LQAFARLPYNSIGFSVEIKNHPTLDEAFGRSSRIILKFAKNTHINGFSTFLVTGRKTLRCGLQNPNIGWVVAKQDDQYCGILYRFVVELWSHFFGNHRQCRPGERTLLVST
jgi:hypothetical protein